MAAIASTNENRRNVLRNFNTSQTARERLFLDMRVGQDAFSEHPTCRVKDLPKIRIVIPAFVGMFQSDGESPRPGAARRFSVFDTDIRSAGDLATRIKSSGGGYENCGDSQTR